MELSFSDKSLRDLCYSDFLAHDIYGPEVAQKLKNRLADLAAVQTVSELFLLPGKPEELTDEHQGQMALVIAGGFRLFFKSAHLRERIDQSGKIDWTRVRRVKLIGLEQSYE